VRGLRRRIENLEQHSGVNDGDGLQVLLMCAGQEFALDSDRCVEILRECGYLRSGAPVSLLYFFDAPDDLDAKQLERYLREHGGEICGGSRRFPVTMPLEFVTHESDCKTDTAAGRPVVSPRGPLRLPGPMHHL
jgi:hypothetical protein